jgi:hypothetical protein
VALVYPAHALASIVLPVPGGPYNKTPLGGLEKIYTKKIVYLIPIFSNFSLCVIGKTIASLNSIIYFSKPPISV